MPKRTPLPMEQIIRRRLALEIQARGWSESETARRIGVSQSQLWDWLHRDKSGLRFDHGVMIAQMLGVKLEDLIDPSKVPEVAQCPQCGGTGLLVAYPSE